MGSFRQHRKAKYYQLRVRAQAESQKKHRNGANDRDSSAFSVLKGSGIETSYRVGPIHFLGMSLKSYYVSAYDNIKKLNSILSTGQPLTDRNRAEFDASAFS